MRKIKPENINVGDSIYMVDRKDKKRRYILKKILDKKKETFKWWFLKDKSDKRHLFEMTYTEGVTDMSPDVEVNTAFMIYTIHRLNKKEVSEFNKLLILKNL